VSEQPTLFTTPAEDRAAAAEEVTRAFYAACKVPGGWQCPQCGGFTGSRFLLDMNHGCRPFDDWCWRVYLRRNHARHALRTGNRADWVSASADLREIAAWRARRG
jgi:hypothetical protein